MAMKVVNCLAAMGLAVNNKAGAVFRAAVFFGQLLRFEKQLPNEGCIGRIRIHYVINVLFGNYQKMHRRLGIKIVESKDFLIFVHFIGRDLPSRYFTENAIVHDHEYITNCGI